MKFEYQGKILSSNSVYSTNRYGFRFLSNEGKTFKFDIQTQMMIAQIPKNELKEGKEKLMRLDVFASWYTKEQKIRKRDLDNTIKLIKDAVCEYLGFDDSEIFKEVIVKKNRKTEGFKIFINYL